jgi:hypothetical protein
MYDTSGLVVYLQAKEHGIAQEQSVGGLRTFREILTAPTSM